MAAFTNCGLAPTMERSFTDIEIVLLVV